MTDPPISGQQGPCLNPSEANLRPYETGYDVETRTVLIVDDETDVIQALKLRLETAGYRVITASNGTEALDLLRATDVDLILADLMMPNLDGLELTRRIRQDQTQLGVQVLLFSCNDDPIARNLALEFGALDYLSKTLGGRKIVSRVQDILTAVSLPGGPSSHNRPAYGLAEADLISQLRAISNNYAPTPQWRASVDPPHPGLTDVAWAAEDLLDLTKALDRYI